MGKMPALEGGLEGNATEPGDPPEGQCGQRDKVKRARLGRTRFGAEML